MRVRFYARDLTTKEGFEIYRAETPEEVIICEGIDCHRITRHEVKQRLQDERDRRKAHPETEPQGPAYHMEIDAASRTLYSLR